MALGKTNEKKKVYLSISQGKVAMGSGDDKQYYDFLDGMLENITTKESKFDNGIVKRWYIDMRDGEDIYTLCLPYSSGTYKSLILSLASNEALSRYTPIRIEPYLGKNNFTKLVVYADGVKLDWVTRELPPEELVNVGGKQVKDDTKRMQFIEEITSKVLHRIGVK